MTKYAPAPRRGAATLLYLPAMQFSAFAGHLPSHGRLAAFGLAMLLAACASTPQGTRGSANPNAGTTSPMAAAIPPAPASERDGPEARPPPDLAAVPDAEPKLEPIRDGGPNKPYAIAGREYVPITQDQVFTERGLASWYGKKFHGRRTASGELYNMYAMTAAHKTLPIPSYARVRNPANGAEVLVRVNDRGPFVAKRIIDLSYTAALKLGLLRGVGIVELERITFEDIRTGAWRRDGNTDPDRAATAVAAAAAAAAGDTAAPPPTDTPPPEANPPAVAPAPAVAAAPPAEPITNAAAAPAYTTPARGFWVQLGAFRERLGAEEFQRRVMSEHDWLAPLLAVFIDLPLFRLQAGPYPSRDEALSAAERVRVALRLVPVIVERR